MFAKLSSINQLNCINISTTTLHHEVKMTQQRTKEKTSLILQKIQTTAKDSPSIFKLLLY